MENLGKLVYWITERERVRLAKEAAAPKPWSEDPVFQRVYFCNVNRENDRVTKWIRKNWSHPENANFEFAMCLARLLNNTNTLDALGYPWDAPSAPVPKMIRAQLEEMVAAGETIWGNAYVVTTHGLKMSKLEYLEKVLGALWDNVNLRGQLHRPISLSRAHSHLMSYEGFGSFMAAQVVADLKNTHGHPLIMAPDWWTWAAHGPGSLRGLQWVQGQHGVKVTPGNFLSLLHRLHQEVVTRVQVAICMQDLQNCLCEFDKYMRVSTGVGRSKRTYPGNA